MADGDTPNDPPGAPPPRRRPNAPRPADAPRARAPQRQGARRRPSAPVSSRRAVRSTRKPPQLELGSVLADTFRLALRDAPAYLAFAVVAMAPWFLYEYITQGRVYDAVLEGRFARPRGLLGNLIARLLATSGVLVLMGAIAYVVVERLRDARPNYGRAVSVSLSRIVSMLAIAITMSLIVYLLSIFAFFIVYQFFGRTGHIGVTIIIALVALLSIMGVLFTRFCAAIPVTIMERRPAFKSMARSDMLTTGVRWKVLAGGLLLYLVPISLFTYFTMTSNMIMNWKAITIAGFVTQVVLGILVAVLCAVIYHDTRTSSEGVDATKIASVFS